MTLSQQAAEAVAIRQSAIQAIRSMGLLGFDCLSDALGAVLSHSDYASRWEIDPEHRATLEAYRAAYVDGFEYIQAVAAFRSSY